jgi:O-antigen/teichoic acid export membrane protein
MRVFKLPRTLHFFGTGVIDQVMLSAANFLAGLFMIRHTSDVAYGQFVLAQSAIVLLVSTQGAWLTGPLAIVVPKKTLSEKTYAIGAMRFSQARFLRRLGATLLLATVAGWLFGLVKSGTALVTAGIMLACWAALQREYLRGALIMCARQRQLLQTDIVYAACLIIGVFAATFVPISSGIFAVAALIVAARIAEAVSYRMLGADPGWVSGDAKPWWREIRPIGLWATVGSLIYWIFGQSYSYILAACFSLTAVSNVNAARLLLTPIFVFTIGINNVLVFRTANWLAEIGLTKTLRRLVLVLLILTALDLIYIGFIWSFRGWLISSVLHKTIADRDTLLLLWASVALIFLPREILQAVLFASGQAKSMTWLIGVSAVVSLALTGYGIGIGHWGPTAVLIGQIAGECANVLGLAWMLWRHVRINRPQPPAQGPGIFRLNDDISG